MSENLELFYDDIWAALRGLVSFCGGSKVVAKEIWPSKNEKGGQWLDDCLNPDRAAKLDPEELMVLLRIARKRNFHGVMRFIGDDVGYEVKPKNPEDEKTALQRSFVKAVNDVQRLADQLEKFGGIRAVS